MTVLANQIRTLLTKRTDVKTRAPEQAWQALADATDGFRATGAHAAARAALPDAKAPVQWTVTEDGIHTATGPHGSAAVVRHVAGSSPSFSWAVADKSGLVTASGEKPSLLHAKVTAETAMKLKDANSE